MRSEGPPDPKRFIPEIKEARPLKLLPEMRALSRHERAFYAAQTQGLRQDINERKKYASRIFVLCSLWIFAVLGLLIAEGLARWTHFALSETVLLALIGSTTANILGVFLIVARYLFPGNDKS